MVVEDGLLIIEKRRGRRRRLTDRTIKSRVDYIQRFWYKPEESRLLIEQHRLAKKHPADCGRAKCNICHYEKIFSIGKKKYKGRRI